MSRSIFKRFMPLAVVAVVSACVYYGCTESPVDPGGGGAAYTPDIPTDGKSVEALLKDGHTALKAKDYDVALAYYEAAYKQDANDPKTITYSTLAKIAKISIEPTIANLFKNRLGFTKYPVELNALLSNDWLTNYPSYEWTRWYNDESIGQVEWLDMYFVNDDEYYPEVDKVGYYHYTIGYVFATSKPRYERYIVGEYYDVTTRTQVFWLIPPAMFFGGVDKEGYYSVSMEDDGWVLTFVSDEPIYEEEESLVTYYYDEDLDEYFYWYDEEEVKSGNVDKVGYYYSSSTYTFVSDVKKDVDTSDAFFPGLSTPEWVKGGGNSIYGGTLVDGVPTAETWSILLLANLLDKNTNGLNALLDETIAGVFGGSFNEACARIAKLKDKDAITLDAEFLKALNLENLIDEFDLVGWAELNALTSFMTAVKASLEWVASYDWNTNLNFLKFAWGAEEDFYNRLKSVSVSDLPFNNNFLNARPGKMEIAKADFVKAIEGLNASYGAIIDNDFYPTEMKDAYPTLRSGAEKLIAAIQNGGKFYIADDPTKGNWPSTGKNGIDMGLLFKEGYFSLPNLFETSGGKPVFYVDGTQLTPLNYVAKIDNAGYAGLRFKTKRVTDVIIGFEGDDGNQEINFPGRYAKLLFEKYYGVSSQSKARIAPLANARMEK